MCGRLRDLGLERYKFVVQTVVGERREQGVRMASRCFFDANADCQVTESLANVSPCLSHCLRAIEYCLGS